MFARECSPQCNAHNAEQNSGIGNQFHTVFKCTILIQLESRPVIINVIHVFALMADEDYEEIEQFNEVLDGALSYTKSCQVNIVMGDFNAKVGVGSTDKVLG